MLRRSFVSLSKVPEMPPCSFTPKKYTGISVAEIQALREKYQHPCNKHLFKEPLTIVEGKMQYVWDADGRRYLDLFGGVCTISVGHSHPRIEEVAKEQMGLIQHTTMLYNHPKVYQFMDYLNTKMPKGEEWVYHITNSGSESTDFSMLAARAYTRNHHIVTLRNGYHGMSEGSRNTVGLSNWKHAVMPGAGYIRTIAPIEYRGLFGDNVEMYLDDFECSMKMETPQVAAFIAERIQGIGGLYPLLNGFLPKAYESVRKMGGVCISDEVQCACGRLGDTYWGFEQDEGAIPDIIQTAKSIGNGAPVGVVAMKRKIADALGSTAFFNTYGGNPVAMAIALENLKIIDDENIMDRAKTVGKHLTDGLRALQKKHEVIGDVRGKGYMVGLELVSNREKKQPLAVDKVLHVLQAMRDVGILIGRGGTFGNVIRLQGPMCSTTADMDFFLYHLDKILPTL